jgi:hypothetical protein
LLLSANQSPGSLWKAGQASAASWAATVSVAVAAESTFVDPSVAHARLHDLGEEPKVGRKIAAAVEQVALREIDFPWR